MKLETDRLQIIPCTKETFQIAANQNYINGPQISNHLENLIKEPSLLYWGCWFVVRKSDDQVLGDIGFKGKPDENGTVEVGYGFLEEYWGKGYATEAVGALMAWAFNESKVEKIKAETLKDNHGSMRVLEKLGMQRIHQSESMVNWEVDKRSYQI
ncbi:GNAT family N-acetyltransferase [Ureibacillus aquaedulcis]|uniref:GNAT family N-acetyltransferase n=1 Tax=Ureibacillus aquaedulcis TaxID=3058421 RepID=A0ABT8GKX5_9BACL|nr:GNAT family N-acetyltransferase [Ureibacillus sp. BA0131]MDN4491926.1 GNAT family N-acetyltransferase [Ureibacillus sp. BA0131]